MVQNRFSLAAPLVLLSSLALVSCSDPIGPPKELKELPRPLTAAEHKVSAAANDFTFALFNQVNSTAGDSNIFISPLSASMALGMTMNGAAGSTYEGMRGALGFSQAELADINAGYKGLIALLRGLDRTTDFRIANSIWYRSDLSVLPDFVTTTKNHFDARVSGLDFGDPSALATINGWVNEATAQKIPRILESIRQDDVMFLINAIYFKGSWRYAFDRSKTLDAPFHLEDGTTQTIRLMTNKAKYRFGWSADFRGVDLLYGNGAFSMTVLLPPGNQDIDDFAATLHTQDWQAWMDRFQEGEGYVGLPKFKLEYQRTLNDDLKAMGMDVAFNPDAADFSNMAAGGSDFFISFVKQKTYVDVYEEGTEAAAATAVGVSATSGPAEFIVDRPFIFVIRERLTGTILFIGKIKKLPPV